MIVINKQAIGKLKDSTKISSKMANLSHLKSKGLESLIPTDPNTIKVEAQEKKKQIVILGACSGEDSVVARFHSEALKPYKNAGFKFIGVDTKVDETGSKAPPPAEWSEKILPLLNERGLDFANQYYHPDNFFNKLRENKNFAKSIAGVIIATPPAFHLSNLKDLVTSFKAHNINDVPIVLEKPVSLIGQEAEIAELTQQYPGNVIGADFAITSPALNYALESGLLERVGNIKAILGRCIENYDVEKFVDSIQKRNLCDLDKSGGGIGFDMGTHAAGPIARILDSLGLSLDKAEVKQCLMKRASPSSLRNKLREFNNTKPIPKPEKDTKNVEFDSSKWNPLAETYWYSHSSLNQGEGKTPIEIYTEAGKDTNTDDYSIVQINGDKGTLIISAGTKTGHKNAEGQPDEKRNVRTKPFVLFIPKGLSTDNKAELYTFEPGIGYEGVFNLFMKKANQKAEASDDNLINSLVKAGVSSVDYIKRTYLHGLQKLVKNKVLPQLLENQTYQKYVASLLKVNPQLKLGTYAFGTASDLKPASTTPKQSKSWMASSRDLAKTLAAISLKA